MRRKASSALHLLSVQLTEKKIILTCCCFTLVWFNVSIRGIHHSAQFIFDILSCVDEHGVISIATFWKISVFYYAQQHIS